MYPVITYRRQLNINERKLITKEKNMKKSIAILLALLMMAGTLGCSSENAEEKETTQAETTASVGETETQESETEEETEAPVFDGIAEKKFDGRDFNFLYRTTEEYQFYTEEYTGDAINDAVRDRNLLVESTFDTKIVGIPVERGLEPERRFS